MGIFQKIKDKVSDLTGRIKIGPYKHYVPDILKGAGTIAGAVNPFLGVALHAAGAAAKLYNDYSEGVPIEEAKANLSKAFKQDSTVQNQLIPPNTTVNSRIPDVLMPPSKTHLHRQIIHREAKASNFRKGRKITKSKVKGFRKRLRRK